MRSRTAALAAWGVPKSGHDRRGYRIYSRSPVIMHIELAFCKSPPDLFELLLHVAENMEGAVEEELGIEQNA